MTPLGQNTNQKKCRLTYKGSQLTHQNIIVLATVLNHQWPNHLVINYLVTTAFFLNSLRVPGERKCLLLELSMPYFGQEGNVLLFL